MKMNSKPQKVDIDSYFSQFSEEGKKSSGSTDDHSSAVPISPGLNKFLPVSSQGNQALSIAAGADNSASDLPNLRSPLERESAYRTVSSLKKQLQQAPQPQVESIPEPDHQSCSNPCPRRVTAWTLGLSAVAILASAALGWSTTPGFKGACSKNDLCALAQATIRTKTEFVFPKSLNSPTVNSLDAAVLASGLVKAQIAGEMAQTAKTPEEWKTVSAQWEQAIADLIQIPESSAVYEKAQDRLKLYRKNLLYADGEYDSFREAVNAAEAGSKLVQTASTPAEWKRAVEQWQEALNLMQAVPAESTYYDIAQEKLAEYSTKFAYAQSRYLATR